MSMILMRLGSLAISACAVPCGKPAEDDVDVVPIHLVGSDECRQIEAGKMREDLRQALPGMALGDQRGELDARDAARQA